MNKVRGRKGEAEVRNLTQGSQGRHSSHHGNLGGPGELNPGKAFPGQEHPGVPRTLEVGWSRAFASSLSEDDGSGGLRLPLPPQVTGVGRG